MDNKVLGKGLSALIPQNTGNQDQEIVQRIKILLLLPGLHRFSIATQNHSTFLQSPVLHLLSTICRTGKPRPLNPKKNFQELHAGT